MTENKTNKIEREYVIPLREKCRTVPRYKKTPKAIRTIKEFLVRHMKIRDNDLNKIKIDKYLNEQIWIRGIKRPIHKVKVKAIKEGDIVRVYAIELPTKLEFKKKREEKKSLEQEKAANDKKKEKQATQEEDVAENIEKEIEKTVDKKETEETKEEIKKEDKPKAKKKTTTKAKTEKKKAE